MGNPPSGKALYIIQLVNLLDDGRHLEELEQLLRMAELQLAIAKKRLAAVESAEMIGAGIIGRFRGR
jgi:hypothetical protein